ncbi:MAG: hypothetical protein UR93_C0026G0003 [Berkelbacteria bacterium GW2011_GWA2_35_9]|uniref:Uncharacterized protein n=1 Tax=Berkelbacteria bacterium GW2011_GWA2_35_9 TaxID=1618333 RepID=A0A0G0G8A2_9BACT|nr:MAG: hypothetical protein UR93_C0026G0003 [Berkelbacteria bacterium GW2011_GWA2_35_9]
MNIKWSRIIGLIVIILLLFGVFYEFKKYKGSNSISGKKEIAVDEEKSQELLDKVNNFGSADLRGEVVSVDKDAQKIVVKVLDYSPTREIPDEIRSYFIVGENEQKTAQLNSFSKVTTGKLEDLDGKESSFDSIKEGQKVLFFGYENLRSLSSFIPREARILE